MWVKESETGKLRQEENTRENTITESNETKKGNRKKKRKNIYTRREIMRK
jgi:hypothetical protein